MVGQLLFCYVSFTKKSFGFKSQHYLGATRE